MTYGIITKDERDTNITWDVCTDEFTRIISSRRLSADESIIYLESSLLTRLKIWFKRRQLLKI